MGAVVALALGACGQPEEEERATLGSAVQAAGSAPDFVITSVTGPASVVKGQQFTATVTVCNQGTLSDGCRVELYLSADATIIPPPEPGPTTDQPVGGKPSFLNPGQCETLSISAGAWVPSVGAWYLGAAADPGNSRPELREDNNIRGGSVVSVTR